MNEKIKKYCKEHSDMLLPCGIILIILIIGAWIMYDSRRNERIYHDTDRTVERIEKRLDDIGQRVDSLQKRNAENQKAVERTIVTVERSRENAEVIERGITEAEQRLDNAIQASGRIKNRIAEIEAENRKGKKNP